MPVRHSNAFIGIFLLFPAMVLCQDPRLSYELVPGQVYPLSIEIRQTSSSESMEREEIQLFSKCRMWFRVDSVLKEGLIHMTVKYSDLMLSMLAPRMGVDLNSASGSSPLLSSMLDSLEQFYFRAGLKQTGELIYMEGLQEAIESLGSASRSDTMRYRVVQSTLEEVYGPDAFSSLAGLFLWVYPVIQPLSNWTNDITYYFNTKPVRMVNRFYLSRSNDKAVTIQGIGMLNGMEPFREMTELGEVSSSVSGSQTYDFQMDRKTGWPRRCVSRQRILIETTILESESLPKGLKIPSYTETEFEVSGIKQEDR